MKRTLLSLFILSGVLSTNAQHNVTFQVNMNQYSSGFGTPEVNGTFNNWCGNCNAMSDPDGDNIWEVTLPLTQDSIEYKFSHDAWAGQENLTAGSACTKTSGGFTNRFIHITGDTVLPAVCWASCSECIPPPDTSMVTFQVDMSLYGNSFTTPEVNGTFNNWCGNCNAMSDPDGDNIWEVTLPLVGASIEYKFSHDAWTGQEELTEGSPCTVTNGGFTNRFLALTGDTILPPVCWGFCVNCDDIPDTNNVTFQVDMRGYTGTFTTPEVNGLFNGWCGNCNAMEDLDGDSIWSITLPLFQDSTEYKFSHDNWTGQEELTEGSECTKTTSGFTNRFIVITGDTILPAVCWASCEICPVDSTPPAGLVDFANMTFSVFPNPANTVLSLAGEFSSEQFNVVIMNAAGQSVLTERSNQSNNISIDISSLENGVYFLQLQGNNFSSMKRFVKVK